MKKTISMLALTLAASALTAFSEDAPSPTPAAPAPKHQGAWRGGPGGARGGPMRAALEALSPAEREQLKAAHQKAKGDPVVADARQKAEAAHKAVREAEKAAMLKADPTIGPVLEKLEAARRDGKPPEPPQE